MSDIQIGMLAGLVVGAALSWCVFLWRTYQADKALETIHRIVNEVNDKMDREEASKP